MTLVRRVARPMLAAMFVAGGLDQLKHPAAQGRDGATRSSRRSRRRRACPTTPSCWCGPTAWRWWAPGRCSRWAASPASPRRCSRRRSCRPRLRHTRSGTSRTPRSGPSRRSQFLKNLGLLGGLLLAAVDTEGKPGLAYRATPGQRQRPPGGPHDPPRGAARGPRRRPRGQAEGGPGAACPRLTGPHRPPTGPVDARVVLPGSKSLTNRYLVLAALANDVSRLRAPLRSRDTLLMAGALRTLGARGRGRRRRLTGS